MAYMHVQHTCMQVLVTASGCMRGKKVVPLKRIADGACEVAARGGVQVRVCVSRLHILLIWSPNFAILHCLVFFGASFRGFVWEL